LARAGKRRQLCVETKLVAVQLAFSEARHLVAPEGHQSHIQECSRFDLAIAFQVASLFSILPMPGEWKVENQPYTRIDLVRNDDPLVLQRLECVSSMFVMVISCNHVTFMFYLRAYRCLLKLHGPSLNVVTMGRPTALSSAFHSMCDGAVVFAF
jgi:hypothetical protein